MRKPKNLLKQCGKEILLDLANMQNSHLQRARDYIESEYIIVTQS